MATRQLLLIPSDGQGWKLDEHTKAVGRAGVARARQALTPRPSEQPVETASVAA